MKYSCAVVAIVYLVCMTELRNQAYAGLPPQCHPNKIHGLPSRVTRICMALYTLKEIGDSMEEYVAENTAPLITAEELVGIPQRDTMKRQDVDHVFLRFGKR